MAVGWGALKPPEAQFTPQLPPKTEGAAVDPLGLTLVSTPCPPLLLLQLVNQPPFSLVSAPASLSNLSSTL